MPAKKETNSPTTNHSRVLIDCRKVYARAFDDDAMRLYIPVDTSGEVTSVGASRLICWSVDPTSVENKGDLVNSDLWIADLLLWNPIDIENDVMTMAKLARCVPFNTIGKLNQWLSNLVRSEIYDIELNQELPHGALWVRN